MVDIEYAEKSAAEKSAPAHGQIHAWPGERDGGPEIRRAKLWVRAVLK
jgi:hypothetical protein